MERLSVVRPVGPVLVVPLVLLAGCASSNRLNEFNFRGAGLAVVTVAPPHPQVFTQDFYGPEDRGWLRSLLRIGSEMARDAQAERAGEKLAEASEEVDVAGLMADQVLERSARLLRARAVESVTEADFELEVRVQEYGIRADSWDSHADFFIHAEVLLLESSTGSRIWKESVEARDPINPGSWSSGGALGNLITAQALGRLSVAEMKEALEDLAVYSADHITSGLEEGLDRSRR
jgi:hypothetical protein